jgi:ubiquinol-cytochrome c reductase cytochrome b subunit
MLPFLLVFLALVIMTSRTLLTKVITLAVVAAMAIGFFVIDAKFWGVVAMGVSTLIFFAMPWIDHSPVKSMRYRPGWHFWLLMTFVVVFLVLGFFGVQAPSPVANRLSQIGTLLYFGFFLFMPWWSRMGTFKPVPERITFAGH